MKESRGIATCVTCTWKNLSLLTRDLHASDQLDNCLKLQGFESSGQKEKLDVAMGQTESD
ncbi:unnamed protein product [Malus baccata var. baccata]|uniref:Uncharacterized protein n=1 Tax=Malus domestica TaxID=3750 RepID=A0A498IXG2_MALDO|nr:hypothetical protein DVH24_037535 [Malus domestica]